MAHDVSDGAGALGKRGGGSRSMSAVVIKLSGAAIGRAAPNGAALNGPVLSDFAHQIARIAKTGVACGVVIGGGNIVRGNQPWGASAPSARKLHELGMLATAINARALHSTLQSLSSIPSTVIAKPGVARDLAMVSWDEAVRGDLTGGAFIVAGGTGRPGVSTDVAAALLASDLGAKRVIMSKDGVDGIYTGDPNPSSTRYDPTARVLLRLTTKTALDLELSFMDQIAVELCDAKAISVHVVGAQEDRAIERAFNGESLGSLMTPVGEPDQTWARQPTTLASATARPME